MKIFERLFYIGVILCLIWMVIIQRRNPNIDIITIPGDSIPYEVEIIKPVPYDTIIYMWDTLQLAGDTVFLHDTIKVYNDYFKMYSYKVDTNVSDVDVSINSMIKSLG